VLIIREKNGVRNTARIDLSNKESLNSPYYYLQQNDIVYVEAEKAKGLQASASNYYLPLIATVASLISVLSFIILR
jgi:polysaccharide export outer membrane protein